MTTLAVLIALLMFQSARASAPPKHDDPLWYEYDAADGSENV